MARILDQKTATSGVNNRLKSAKNHLKLVCVGVQLEANQKGERMYQKGISLHFQNLAEDISWSCD